MVAMNLTPTPAERAYIDIDADLLARDLSDGMNSDAIRAKRGWSKLQLDKRLSVLSKRDLQLVKADPKEVFVRYAQTVEAEMENLNRVKTLHAEGAEKTVITTVETKRINDDGDPEKHIVREEVPARNGVSASELIAAVRVTMEAAAKGIEVGQSLGLIPKDARVEPTTVNNTQNNIVVQAARDGDWEALERIARGDEGE